MVPDYRNLAIEVFGGLRREENARKSVGEIAFFAMLQLFGSCKKQWTSGFWGYLCSSQCTGKSDYILLLQKELKISFRPRRI